ncbi:hypothetical protein [Mycetohabitans endofungorum]|uniref:hypothetical protein n=1 Tax=Mycetohabitans endofungorum TaxID=417203 RepID=UPI00396A8B1C
MDEVVKLVQLCRRDYTGWNVLGIPAQRDRRFRTSVRFPYRQARQSWSFSRHGQSEKVEINGRLTANFSLGTRTNSRSS